VDWVAAALAILHHAVLVTSDGDFENSDATFRCGWPINRRRVECPNQQCRRERPRSCCGDTKAARAGRSRLH